MAKQYTFMRVDKKTREAFNKKKENINKTLNKMGLKTKINTIDITKLASQKPLFLDDKELMDLAKNKFKKI